MLAALRFSGIVLGGRRGEHLSDLAGGPVDKPGWLLGF